MITKERLEELIKQEATIYDNFICEEHLTKNHYIGIADNKISLMKKNDDEEILVDYIELLYETKEEAEFVAKYYDTRIEKFEPPFELDKDDNYRCLSEKYGYINIYANVDIYDNIFAYTVEIDEEEETFDTYQEAVDYAHKLFKGE